MIEIPAETGVILVGAVSALVVAWGVFFSTRAAIQGPVWARRNLESSQPRLMIAVILALIAAALVRPMVFGVALIYLTLMLWYLARMLGRNFNRLAELGGMAELDLDSRAAIIRKARNLNFVGGPVMLASGIGVAFLYRALGAIVMLVGVLVLLNGLLLRSEPGATGLS